MYQSSDIYQAINKQTNKYKPRSTAMQWSFFVQKFIVHPHDNSECHSNIKLKIQTEIYQKKVLTIYGEAVRLSVREMGKYGKHAVIY